MSIKQLLMATTVLITWVTATTHLSADCKTKAVVKTNDEIQVVVPFAVPVGIPVAPFAPYFYSYQQVQGAISEYATPPSNRMPAVLPDRPGLSSAIADYSSTSTHSTSEVVTHCAICHGGTAPKAKLSLEHPESLRAEDRLKTIQAVVSGQMPKGSQLSSEEMRSVIAELAGQVSPIAESSENSSDKKTF
jgi:mono/diheme cytochrome c family protein